MAERPHRLVVLGDYAKTVIAIGSALLAICVTFSTNLPTVKLQWLRGLPLIAILWFFLLGAIVIAIWMMTYLIGVISLHEQVEKAKADIAGAAGADTTAKAKALERLEADQRRALDRLAGGANASYVTLGIAALVLIILGLFPRVTKLDLPAIISRLTNETAQIKKVQPTQITVTELRLSPNGDSYSVTLSPGSAATPWQAEVDAKSGSIRSLH